MFRNILFVGLGGAIGTIMRFGIYNLLKPNSFPYATLIINITGSLAIGLVMGFALKNINFDNNWKVFLATGMCGGFTTFSAFSYENFQLLQEGKYFSTMIYMLASVIVGIAATWAGYKLATN